MPATTLSIPTPDGQSDAFAAFPGGGGTHPGVLLYPDAFGPRPVLWDMARELAGHGYYVLVPNVFHRHRPAPVFDLDLARELREAIHAAATATALQDALPASAVQVINECSARGQATALLTPESERRWRVSGVEDALGVIAADAISLVAGERDGKFALCASPTCRAAFFDASQSRTRRWCDMNTCGNRQKKARFNANRKSR
nr:ABATE domain-containing protein [Amycolatopsis lurida]